MFDAATDLFVDAATQAAERVRPHTNTPFRSASLLLLISLAGDMCHGIFDSVVPELYSTMFGACMFGILAVSILHLIGVNGVWKFRIVATFCFVAAAFHRLDINHEISIKETTSSQ